ncbi:hypothetical protein FE782_07265 [Paenibacillus antri]|uniref:DNA-binding response regulator n=1 Tax=Paenibacillus antri TaxID=2582848 RepID=A0A5R9GIA7_9BACL|nr:hypothetical protein [Paenibacillus antri]TLS53154.1 hypothetical protein FE782_07265 [Paenibacillus antri]
MMEMERSFDEAYEVWFRKHLKESAGDRRLQLERRMSKGSPYDHECAETRFLRDIWWPVYGELESLIPEYEIVDGLGKSRYLDHAMIRYPVLADLEVDGYASHQKEASRWSFADDRRRDAGLRMLGWDVLRIAFSDMQAHPLACQQLLSRWMDSIKPKPTINQEWKEHIIQYARYHSPFTISDIMQLLRTSEHTSRKLLKELLALQVLISAGTGDKRVTCYRLNEQYLQNRKPQLLKF